MTNTLRRDFSETWTSLIEMPQPILLGDAYETIVNNIKNRITSTNVIDLGNNYFKIVGNQTAYYWYQLDDLIILGIELSIRNQGYIVSMVGKNKDYYKKEPYADSLYSIVVNDIGKGVRFMSDTLLTNEGYGIWKRLFNDGNKITVYDRLHPGKTHKTFDSVDEMNEFFKDKTTHDYQFVLSSKNSITETVNFFNTRRYWELSGINLENDI